MPFAVTHVLLTIILVDLYRDYITKYKKYFSLHTLLIAGVAGMLPDIDVPLGWFLNFFGIELLHRTITHTPLFGLIFLIPAFILWRQKKNKIAMYFFVATFGILFHIFLDFLISPDIDVGIMLFYPLSTVIFEVSLLGNLSIIQTMRLFAGIDAIILLLWLWHEEVKHKILDFI